MSVPDLEQQIKSAVATLEEVARIAKVPVTPHVIASSLNAIVSLITVYLQLPPNVRGIFSAVTRKGLSGALLTAVYGLFLTAWSEFDLLVEILLMRELKIDKEETSILCGGMQSGAKLEILSSLISRDEKRKHLTTLLAAVQTAASRNTFAHGVMEIDTDKPAVTVSYRTTKHEYVVRQRTFDSVEIAKHTMQFLEAFKRVREGFDVSETEIDDYKKSISQLGPIHAARAMHRTQSLANLRQAKRKSRARKAQ